MSSYIHSTLLKLHSESFRKPLKIYARSSKILPGFVDKTLLVHTGKKFLLVSITEEMIGHCVGEFVYTKTRAMFKVKKKK